MYDNHCTVKKYAIKDNTKQIEIHTYISYILHLVPVLSSYMHKPCTVVDRAVTAWTPQNGVCGRNW